MHRDAPFFVVVVDHERAVAHSRPLTPLKRSFFQFVSTS
jgi:hypothetical protein